MAFLDNTGVARLVTDLKSKFATLVSGAVAVVQGGTGKTTHTTNAVLTGNGTNAVNNVATADGALYATAANGAAQFGTLPVAQGGTAGTTEAEARENLEVPVNAAIATVESTTATANHAIGDHFMLDDKLKTATAAIATGETINATNSADDTVQAQIDTLRDSVSGTFTTSLVTTQSGYSLRGGDYVKRFGLIGISLGININNTIPENVQVAVGTITSANIRPIVDTNTFITSFGVSDGKILSVSIQTDGSIYIRPNLDEILSGSYIWIRTTYLTSV